MKIQCDISKCIASGQERSKKNDDLYRWIVGTNISKPLKWKPNKLYAHVLGLDFANVFYPGFIVVCHAQCQGGQLEQ